MTLDLAKEIMGAIGKNDEVSTVKVWLDTGFPPLNRIISGRYYDGGMPCGRVVELSGAESSGKTAIANECMKAAQRAGGIAGFWDHERSFDTRLAEQGGLDLTPGKFVFKRGQTYEQTVVETIKLLRVVREKKLIDPDAPIVLVWDSLASMVPQQIAEKSADALNMNDNTALARATSASFKMIAQACDDYNALLIILNQTRTKIGVMFGDPTTTPGGDAVKFYCSVRIRLGRTMIKKSASDSTKVGQQIGAECIKNKVSAPFRKCKWNFMFNDDGTGSFDVEGSLVEYMCEHELIEAGGKKSAYCYWEGEKITKKKLAKMIESDPAVATKIKAILDGSDVDDISEKTEPESAA
ncbi:hypothetical protein [Halomonas sp. S2151]|uniref:hypothetical protein n=1 Tax=Halomonas sp. S2151 TaxID=579478 RepID=UPI000698D647|nr:hypothetical protein [Halomonas sp. S2151]